MLRELSTAGLEISSKKATSKKDFITALNEFKPEIILADYNLPVFNGMHAFRLFKDRNLAMPFILVTGSLSEELALECIEEGVDDYILKSSFKRLPQVVKRNLEIKRSKEMPCCISSSKADGLTRLLHFYTLLSITFD